MSSTLHVLIADDDAGTRLVVVDAVEQLGHRATQAEDGADAWRRFQEDPPDVVIAAWDMPGMDGTALARAIRGHDAPYAYVVVLAGAADEAASRAVMEAGADDVILKPVEVAELERRLIAAGRVTALHRRLHDEARPDALTGLGNRLRLAEDLEAVCGRVERYGHVYCVALFGVDRFEDYSDAAGHPAGDDVLRAIAGSLREEIRSGDTLYRYGGEEFLVLLPEQSLDSAVFAAERLRAAVERLSLPHAAGGRVTVSAGVAGIGGSACTPEQVLELADQALHRAKEGGRKRVEVQVGDDDDAAGGGGIRLLIADHDPGVRLTLGGLVGRQEDMEVVGEAATADEVIELAARRRPDVVLLDFDMPGGGAARAATDIRETSPGTKVVALSADSSPATQLGMSRAGAVGYLVKGAPDEEIVRVIRSSARW